jgi:hypothetical protein
MPLFGFESSYPFCANPDCELHVQAGDEGVNGSGNWAAMPDGRIIGRGIYYGVFLCDLCGKNLIAYEISDGAAAA